MSFAAIVGHRRVLTLLAQSIQRGTLPPTLLLVGPSGIGKYRVARAIASALNCLEPAASTDELAMDACGVCRACDRIARGMHVDVLSLEPDDRASIKIDVVRGVLARTAFRPFEGRRRVVVVRDADTLEVQAQNALLKSLEEPPPGTVFVSTTAVPGLLLPTVRSRCMRLRFGRLSERDIQAILTRDHGLSARDARTAAAMADGSAGQALALGDADLATLRETALLLLRQTASQASASARLTAAGLLTTTPSRKERSRDDIALMLRVVASMLRDVELLNAGGDPGTLANPALADEMGSLKRAFAGSRAPEAFSAVDRAIMALDRNAGAKAVGEWLAMQM